MIDFKDEWISRITDISQMQSESAKNMVMHVLITSGSCSFEYNSMKMHATKGCAIITRSQSLISKLTFSEDISVCGFFITPTYCELSGQSMGYTVRHVLLVNANPVMELTVPEIERWQYDLENIFRRVPERDNPFRTETVFAAIWQFVVDCFRITARIYGTVDTTVQMSALVGNFFKLLEAGEFQFHRNIPYYADKLCVSPKHLSETVKKVSGHSANYWITHYTLIGIQKELRNHELSLGAISEMYRFSSAAYFTRYLQIHLGVIPSKLRD